MVAAVAVGRDVGAEPVLAVRTAELEELAVPENKEQSMSVHTRQHSDRNKTSITAEL